MDETQRKPIPMPPRLGGHIALDFTNTAEFRGEERFIEFLHSYAHLLTWCLYAEVLDQPACQQLSEMAQQSTQTEAIFRQAVELREALYTLFSAVIEQTSPPEAAIFNTILKDALAHRHIVWEAEIGGFRWVWDALDLRLPLWKMALEAADLLTAPKLQRVGRCPNCGWLFLDTTRNHSRRWCSMEICGGQMKSRRQYERKKRAHDAPA